MGILEILARIVAAVAIMGAGCFISLFCTARFVKTAKGALEASGDADAGTGELPGVERSSDAEDAEDAADALASISARVDWKMLLLSAIALEAAWICAGAVLRFPLWAVVLTSAIPVHRVFRASGMVFPILFNFVLELMFLALIAIASLVTGIAGFLIK